MGPGGTKTKPEETTLQERQSQDPRLQVTAGGSAEGTPGHCRTKGFRGFQSQLWLRPLWVLRGCFQCGGAKITFDICSLSGLRAPWAVWSGPLEGQLLHWEAHC